MKKIMFLVMRNASDMGQKDFIYQAFLDEQERDAAIKQLNNSGIFYKKEIIYDDVESVKNALNRLDPTEKLLINHYVIKSNIL